MPPRDGERDYANLKFKEGPDGRWKVIDPAESRSRPPSKSPANSSRSPRPPSKPTSSVSLAPAPSAPAPPPRDAEGPPEATQLPPLPKRGAVPPLPLDTVDHYYYFMKQRTKATPRSARAAFKFYESEPEPEIRASTDRALARVQAAAREARRKAREAAAAEAAGRRGASVEDGAEESARARLQQRIDERRSAQERDVEELIWSQARSLEAMSLQNIRDMDVPRLTLGGVSLARRSLSKPMEQRAHVLMNSSHIGHF
eukprot:tig00000057_g127.t1